MSNHTGRVILRRLGQAEADKTGYVAEFLIFSPRTGWSGIYARPAPNGRMEGVQPSIQYGAITGVPPERIGDETVIVPW